MTTIGPQVMVVDDSLTVRGLVCEALWSIGAGVMEATDGLEALQMMESGAASSLELIVLDICMPTMSGFEFLEQMHERKVRLVPVLMLTTEANPRRMQEAMELGARGWLIKPFKRESLLATVKKLVSRFATAPPPPPPLPA